MDTLSLVSTPLPTPPTASLQDYFENDSDDFADDPPSPPPPAPPQMPKWACFIVEVAGSMASDPSDTCRTRSHTVGSSLLSHAISEDPQNFSEEIGHPEWDCAMDEEYSSLMRNNTWELCPLPKGRKMVWFHWLYHTKYAIDGSIDKYKACLVAKGFS